MFLIGKNVYKYIPYTTSKPTDVPFKVIPIEGADKINGNFIPKPELIVLDGQQRLTSLFYALYSPDIPLKNTTNPYTFFIDLQKLSIDNIEDAVFSWSRQWREYKSLLKGNGEYELLELKKEKILPLLFWLMSPISGSYGMANLGIYLMRIKHKK